MEKETLPNFEDLFSALSEKNTKTDYEQNLAMLEQKQLHEHNAYVMNILNKISPKNKNLYEKEMQEVINFMNEYKIQNEIYEKQYNKTIDNAEKNNKSMFYISFLAIMNLAIQQFFNFNTIVQLFIAFFCMVAITFCAIKSIDLKKQLKELEKPDEDKLNEYKDKIKVEHIYHRLKFYSQKQRLEWIKKYILEEYTNNYLMSLLKRGEAKNPKEYIDNIEYAINAMQSFLDADASMTIKVNKLDIDSEIKKVLE